MLKRLLILYVCLSLAASAAYNLCPSIAWDIATHRHGLLIVSVDDDGVWVLNPLSNYGDDWL